jgi:hypothetical protein
MYALMSANEYVTHRYYQHNEVLSISLANYSDPGRSYCLNGYYQIPKPETRNPKPETRNPKPETRNPKLSVFSPLFLSWVIFRHTAAIRDRTVTLH